MRKQIVEKLAALVIAAFGLVAALAWNDAIQTIFKQVFGENDTVVAMLTYAIVVTIAAVIATLLVSRAAEKAKDIELPLNKVLS